MERHLFRFGFERPEEARSNHLHGTDFESSSVVWVLAHNRDEAFAWGEEVADHFVEWLFAANNELNQPWSRSWSIGQFARWIETDREVVQWAEGANVPVVRVGELPLDFAAMKSVR